MSAPYPSTAYPTFSALYTHILTLSPPLTLPAKPTSTNLTLQISDLSLHPTLKAALYILNNNLPSAHFLIRHTQAPPAYEGMFLHGILHRIEGDHDNARAWYRNTTGTAVFKKAWEGGQTEARRFTGRVEGLMKKGEGNKDLLEKESLRKRLEPLWTTAGGSFGGQRC